MAGRSLLEEFSADWTIRSVHRHPAPGESERGVEVLRRDIGEIRDWKPLLADVDLVVSLAWYRAGSDRRFRPLAAGIEGAIRAADELGTPRWVHLSVPEAPPALESDLPYLARKRGIDGVLRASRLRYAIVRPTMLFGARDKLLTVMLRTMARWHRFPMFGDGEYHVSPLSARDLAKIVRREGELGGRRTIDVGGPRRWRYRELTDRMFALLRRPPKYVHFSVSGGRRLARLLEAFGSSLLFAYEVDWLVSDRLGLSPYEGLPAPLLEVEPFLTAEAAPYLSPR